MKKILWAATFILVVVVVLVTVLMYTGHTEDHEQGRIEIEQILEDEEHGYVCEFSFVYEKLHGGEEHSFPVKFHAGSRLVVKELDTETPCRLTVYQDSRSIWSENLTEGMEYAPETEDVYELLLEFGAGKGTGSLALAE